MSIWFEGLNPEQQEAVAHSEGPMLILAGAGSGKTTVLVARAGRLIAESVCPPEGLTVLTFTNKAAKELKARVAMRLHPSAHKRLWAGTFHSFGLGLLRDFHQLAGLPKNFSLIDPSDSVAILKDLLQDVRVVGKEKYSLEKLLSIIGQLRENPKKQFPVVDEYVEVSHMLIEKYEKRMELLGVVDFDGLLLKPIRLIENFHEVAEFAAKRVQQLMVDEFQDTNSLQMKLVNLLVASHRNLTVVGDDDQSIYGWRGAVIENILQFPREYPGARVVKLERNYRSTPAIVNVANEVIKLNDKRHGKILKSEKMVQGELPEVFVCENEEAECEFIVDEVRRFQAKGYAYKDIAVLFRSNGQGALLEGHLRHHQIPYRITGSFTLFERREVKDAMAYLKAAFTHHPLALKRMLNTPNRGLGDVTLEKLVKEAEASQKNFFQVLKAASVMPDLGEAQKRGVATYLSDLELLVQTFQKEGDKPLLASQILDAYLRQIGYRDFVVASAPGGEKKWILIDILGRILDSYLAKNFADGQLSMAVKIKRFLDAMDLREVDTEEADENKLQLLTMHASKGLEYPVVFIMGLEEDLLPHRILGSDLGEERRLFYVGVTRAKEHLLMSRCESRKRHGKDQRVAPSRFLLQIPANLLQFHSGRFRPVTEEQRGQMVADFLAKLKEKNAKKNSSKPPLKSSDVNSLEAEKDSLS